jgi:hypothetical protein
MMAGVSLQRVSLGLLVSCGVAANCGAPTGIATRSITTTDGEPGASDVRSHISHRRAAPRPDLVRRPRRTSQLDADALRREISKFGPDREFLETATAQIAEPPEVHAPEPAVPITPPDPEP